MVIDSSVLLSLLFAEGEEERFLEAILTAGSVHVSVANYLEAAMVAEGRKKRIITEKFDALMELLDPVYEPVTGGSGKACSRCIRQIWQGVAQGGAELRRLLRVRVSQIAQ